MILELYDKNHKKLGVMGIIKSPHVQRTLEYGDETLDFYCPANDRWDGVLEPETYVRTERQEYVVKSVEKSTTSCWHKVSAALNIEELEGCPYEGFESVEQTAQAVADFALEGTGWTADAGGITKKRTIRIEDDTTAWDVVKQIVDTYRCELEIDALNKRLIFTARRGQDRGAYFIERLNLKSLGVKISSYGFFTRIIPIGKDGLHLWIDEKNYLENHQYTDKTITQIWRDERYTVTAALQEDAEAKLEEASRPAKAYTADLVDLAAQSDKYSALEYDLGDEVLLVSEKTGERTRQRIVKLDEYPDDEKANTAELSNVRQTFAQLQKKETEMATQDAVQIATNRIQKTLQDGYYTAEQTKTAISALEGKITLEVSKTYMTIAKGEENAAQAAADAAEKAAAAQAAANSYTDGKLVEYSTTEETKSLISQSADQITLEVSKTYATQQSVKTEVDSLKQQASTAQSAADAAAQEAATAKNNAAAASKAAADAQSAADAAAQAAADAEANAAADATEKAAAAQAAAEAAAAADATAKAAAAEAAAKEAAAADAAEKAAAAQAAANSYTDGKLVEYSTTEETKSLISQSANQITLEVSKTYATQDSLTGYTKTDEVRSRFAMDSTSIEIESGDITFKANTISIDSDNFKLTKNGYVTATGSFKSSAYTGTKKSVYAIFEGRGIFNYARLSDEAEGSEVKCVELNTVAGEKSGYVGTFQNGILSASMVAGVGRGVRIYSEDGTKSVAYMNRGSDGKGYIGINDAGGTRAVSLSQNDAGGLITICHTNGNTEAQIFSINGNPYISIADSSGNGGSIATVVDGKRKLFSEKFLFDGREVCWKWVNGVLCLAADI